MPNINEKLMYLRILIEDIETDFDPVGLSEDAKKIYTAADALRSGIIDKEYEQDYIFLEKMDSIKFFTNIKSIMLKGSVSVNNTEVYSRVCNDLHDEAAEF